MNHRFTLRCGDCVGIAYSVGEGCPGTKGGWSLQGAQQSWVPVVVPSTLLVGHVPAPPASTQLWEWRRGATARPGRLPSMRHHPPDHCEHAGKEPRAASWENWLGRIRQPGYSFGGWGTNDSFYRLSTPLNGVGTIRPSSVCGPCCQADPLLPGNPP